MVNPYRRHTAKCEPGKKYGRKWTKCACPVWAFGYPGLRPNEARVWESLKTCNWEDAKAQIQRRWYSPSGPPDPPKSDSKPKGDSKAVKEAADGYLASRETQNDAPRSLKNYRAFLKTFSAYCVDELHVESVGDLRLDHLERFMAWRKSTTIKSFRSQNQDRTYLSLFFSYCEDHNWVTKNYAKRLKRAKQPKGQRGDAQPELPFPPYTIEECHILLAACHERFVGKYKPTPRRVWMARWTRAMMLLMLDTGYRISNAVQFQKADVRPDRVAQVIQVKTGDTVVSKLKESTIEALHSIPHNPRYPREVSPFFFAYGGLTWESLEAKCRFFFSEVGKHVGIRVCPHRFRNTFGMIMLDEDLRNLESVSKLLGHANTNTTWRYYMHFTKRVKENILKVTECIPDFGKMNPAKVIEFPRAS